MMTTESGAVVIKPHILTVHEPASVLEDLYVYDLRNEVGDHGAHDRSEHPKSTANFA